jgi:hypothetical protein
VEKSTRLPLAVANRRSLRGFCFHGHDAHSTANDWLHTRPADSPGTGAAGDPGNPYVEPSPAFIQCLPDPRPFSWQSRLRDSTWTQHGRQRADVTFAQHMASGRGLKPLGLAPRRHALRLERRAKWDGQTSIRSAASIE